MAETHPSGKMRVFVPGLAHVPPCQRAPYAVTHLTFSPMCGG